MLGYAGGGGVSLPSAALCILLLLRSYMWLLMVGTILTSLKKPYSLQSRYHMIALLQEYFYILHNLYLEWMYTIGQLKRQGMPNAICLR